MKRIRINAGVSRLFLAEKDPAKPRVDKKAAYLNSF
jgi:hypothetical protein